MSSEKSSIGSLVGRLPEATAFRQKLLCLCWEQGHIPQDMRDACIVTLFKSREDRSVCDNYRGISLLVIIGKAFARVASLRLQFLASRVYPESQSGFREGHSTIDMIFSLRQLQEKYREQQMTLFVAFIDLYRLRPSTWSARGYSSSY